MIVKKQFFEYKDKVLIEKAVIKPPFRHGRVFQNGGCFMYMKGIETKVFSSNANLKISNQEAVLLKCDSYFMEIIKAADTQNAEVVAIHLYPEILKKIYVDELPALIEKQMRNPKPKRIVDDVVIAKFVESLEFYFENPSLVNDGLLELKIKELILLLVQTNNVTSILELVTDLYSTRTVHLKEVINLHLYSNLSLEELAKLSQLSLSSFKREFKKQFNNTPSKYINTAKLKKAKDLLRLPDMSIAEVAYEVGFNDPLYFARIFKKQEGIPPSAYRSHYSK